MKQILHESSAGSTVIRAPSIWRYRDLRVAAGARAVSTLGDEVALVALMLRVHDAGHGPVAVTGLLGAAALPSVLLAGIAGRIVDRCDSRRLAVGSGLWQAVACAALAWCVADASGSLWPVFALVALLQVGNAVAGPTWQALVPSIVREDEIGRAIGAMQALTTVAAVAGPAVGGVLVAAGGFGAPLALDAVTFVVLALASFAVRTRRGGAAHGVAVETVETVERVEGVESVVGVRAVERTGLAFLRGDAVLRPLFSGLMVFVLVGEVTNVVEVFLVRDSLGAGPGAFGVVGACIAAGIVVGSLLAGRSAGDRTLVRISVLGAGVIAIACVAAGLAPTVAVLALTWAVLGVANGALNVAAGTLVMTRTPEAVRGQVLALITGVSRAFSVGALVLGGLLGSVASPRVVFVAAGLSAVVVAAVMADRLLGVSRAIRPLIDGVRAAPRPPRG